MNPLNCKEVTTRMAMGDLNQFSLKDRMTIRFHLAICLICRRYERQIKAIGSAWRYSIGQKLDSKDLPSLKSRLLHELDKF